MLQNSIAFIPHGHCYFWQPSLMWLHVISDAFITFAYLLIPLTLIYIIKQRDDVPFDWIFFLSGAFVVSCGITHAMQIWTLWYPDYWVSGSLKAACAIISMTTAIVLFPLVPKFLAIPSPKQLEETNAALSREVSDRKSAETSLAQLNAELEQRVKERTTELQQAQSQLINSEKMSSLGQMVAGIAHEINNPISFIYSNLAPAKDYIRDITEVIAHYRTTYPNPPQETQAQIEDGDLDFAIADLPKVLSSMEVGATRITKIVQSLQTFSALNQSGLKQTNLHENLNSAIAIVQHRLKKQVNRPEIELVKRYGSLAPIECYPDRLNQVFMDLLLNAIEAIEQRYKSEAISEIQASPGRIKIETTQMENHITIRISDNGCGIKSETIDKIFDPFFTTKPVGKGTGLGLSIAYQTIVQQHGGQLRCHSDREQGTEFEIELPLLQKN